MIHKAIALSLGLAIAFPLKAVANPFIDVSVPSKFRLVFEGTAGSQLIFKFRIFHTRMRTVNDCGLLIIPTKADTPLAGYPSPMTYGNKLLDWETLPVNTLPTCKGGTLSEPRNNNFRTADGKSVVVGQTPGTVIETSFPLWRTRKTTFNPCGFRVVTITKFLQWGADSIGVQFGETQTSIANLNLKTAPVCARFGNSYIKYLPL